MAKGFVEITTETIKTPQGILELNRVLNQLYESVAGDGEKVKVYYGYGSPLNAVVANIGSIYMRKDGGANTSIYVKEAGNDLASGWVAK